MDNVWVNNKRRERSCTIKKLILKNWFNTILFCLMSIVLCFGIYNITHVLLAYIHVEQRLAETIGRIIASLGILIFYKTYFGIESFGLKRENLLKGIGIGGFMLFATLNNLASSLLEVEEYPAVSPSLYLIIIVIIEQIFVGVFEEFLVRGLMLNVLLEKIHNDRFKGKITAVILSSLFFGAIHLLNLFSTPQMLNATIAQVFYATFIGVFLGALYLRTNNIWVVVFYHAIYDIVSELPIIFHEIPIQEIVDISVSDAIITAAFASIFVFVGLFLSRKWRDSGISKD